MVEKEREVTVPTVPTNDPYQWSFPKGYIYPTYPPSYNWVYPTTKTVVTERFYDENGNLTREIVTETTSTNYGQTYGVSSTTDQIKIYGSD
jgi:hypothetical protein